MLIILNTKALHQRLSSYKKLANANLESLSQYELVTNGIGVHWPLLDEDLSLKGFLTDELKQMVTNENNREAV